MNMVGRVLFRTAGAMILALVAILLSGCPARQSTSALTQGNVAIRGSNTFGEDLGPRLIADFKRRQPHVTVTLEAKGSGSGWTALLDGTCDIAASTRDPTPNEKAQLAARGIELANYMVGYYGVAVIVGPDNPLSNLTRAQVKGIFTGTLRNWKELGGPDLPIRVCIRDAVAGTYLGFRELAMDNQPYAANAQQFTSYPQIVEEVAHVPGAVGYAGMTFGGGEVKAVAISGTRADTDSVNEGSYPYARAVRLYTDKKKESPAAQAFIRFAQGTDGQKIVEQIGFVRRFEPRMSSLMPED